MWIFFLEDHGLGIRDEGYGSGRNSAWKVAGWRPWKQGFRDFSRRFEDDDFISHNALIKWFKKVNSPSIMNSLFQSTMHYFNGIRKSTPPQNRQLIVSIY